MDKRLVAELTPGPAFLIGNALGGIFAGAGLATVATAIVIVLRWRWDKCLPWMAISILVLTLVLLAIGLAVNDTVYVKLSNTIGSLAFAAIIGVGMLLRPSLLQRTLGYSIHMTAQGWRALHLVWMSVSVARAVANEIVWRNTSDGFWAIYNGTSDIGWIAVFIVATSAVARFYWDKPA